MQVVVSYNCNIVCYFNRLYKKYIILSYIICNKNIKLTIKLKKELFLKLIFKLKFAT